jgi:uncharacterized repeat protein (TIGR03803 family)
MRSDRFFLRSITIFAILSLIVFAPGTVAAAQVAKVLHSFGNRNGDGYGPAASLIFNKGNLYGTTEFSIVGNGSVFELTPTPGGGWTETILHIFDNENTDGAEPLGALVFDASGDLYGTTTASGAYGGGTVFELAPQTGGGWREVVIHTFKNNGVDGSGPLAGLTIDASGNLYGTTVGGGTYGYGVVFELVPRGNGRWTEAILHSFNYNGVISYVVVHGIRSGRWQADDIAPVFISFLLLVILPTCFSLAFDSASVLRAHHDA